MIKDIDDFIREHHHINYCEAVIHPDGRIEYAVPSHVETLIRITGESREVIDEKMPIFDSPIIWLTNYTKCISVYTVGFYKPEQCTNEQIDTLKKLINCKLVSNNNLHQRW